MEIRMKPIGYVRTQESKLPRHWTVSEAEGVLEIDAQYEQGLADIEPGQEIVVLFNFHESSKFSPGSLQQTPPHRDRPFGVFSICSPFRPNPIGLSVVEVLEKDGARLRVKHIDMRDGTPILDIKPHITGTENLPSREAS